MQKPGPDRGRGSASSSRSPYLFRGVLVVLLGLGSLSVAYFMMQPEANSNPAPSYTCDVPEQECRIAKVSLGDKQQLRTTFYVSKLDDEISSGVLALAQGQADPTRDLVARPLRALSSLSSFYTSLCNETAPGRCRGLVLDVGAFIGTHALDLAKLGFEVHAFEPFTPSANLLRCSAAANKLSNLHVLSLAVSDKSGVACLLEPPANRRQLALVAPMGANCTYSPELKVDTVSLDVYWASHLQRREILLLKVDAEGHEDSVLAGAELLFKTAPPRYILIEYYPEMLLLKQVVLNDFFNRIFKANYRMFDCQQAREIPRSADGLDSLVVYKEKNRVTDLLLVRESDYPEGTPLPKWSCAFEAPEAAPVAGRRS